MDVFAWLQQAIAETEPAAGFHPARLADLPEPLRQVMLYVLRLGQVSAGQLACDTSQMETDAEEALQSLVHLGYLKRVNQVQPYQYAVALGVRRARHMPTGIWQALNRKINTG
jgi:hypothetical protein